MDGVLVSSGESSEYLLTVLWPTGVASDSHRFRSRDQVPIKMMSAAKVETPYSPGYGYRFHGPEAVLCDLH